MASNRDLERFKLIVEIISLGTTLINQGISLYERVKDYFEPVALCRVCKKDIYQGDDLFITVTKGAQSIVHQECAYHEAAYGETDEPQGSQEVSEVTPSEPEEAPTSQK